MTHASRALQSQDLSGEGINFGSHTYFLTTHGHGVPPRMSDQLNAGATSETTRTLKTIHTIHSFILTRRYVKHDYDSQMKFGEPWDLKLPDICLTGEENPEKKLHPGNFSRPGIEPGPAA